MKKILCVLLSSILILSVVPCITAAAESDENTPTIQTEDGSSVSSSPDYTEQTETTIEQSATESTEQSVTESTEVSTETTEPATVPSTTESTEPTTESEQPTTESTEPTTESTEPTTESTEPTTESTEPTTEPKTQIKLKKSSDNIYVGGTVKISATVKNGKGKTAYKSLNKSIAKVSSKGTVTGLKKGTATITVRNNGVSVKFKVTVKNPKLSTKSVTVVKGETVKVKITGKVSSIKNKYKSTKCATITTKSKKAKTISVKGKKVTKNTTVKIRVNGVWLSLKVKVIAHEKLKFWIEAKVKKISLNLDELKLSKDISGLYSIETNSYNLYKKKKITEKQHIKYLEGTVFSYSPKYTFSKKGIVKLNGSIITPAKVGKTNLTIKYGKASSTIPIEVTKLTELTYNGKKSKGCYSYKEVYNVLKDSFYNYIIKGEEPKYYSATCFFRVKRSSDLEDKMYEYAEKEFDNGQNFLHFLGEWIPAQSYTLEDDEGNETYEFLDFEVKKSELKRYKKIYDTANHILNDIHIYDFKSNYQKLIVLSTWINENCVYDSDFCATGSGVYIPEEYIIVYRTGVCENYANATTYFCYLLNISCDYVFNRGIHAWNIVKIDNKWYHLDILWNLLFLGNNDIIKHEYHENYQFDNFNVTTESNSLNNEEDKKTYTTLNTKFYTTSNGIYTYEIIYTKEFFDKVFGWNGIEKIDINILNKIYHSE